MMEARPVREWPILSWEDEVGPSKVIFLHDSHTGLKAVVVLDNLALGPATGGVRMLPDVSPDEIFRLARAMTLSLTSLPIRVGLSAAVLSITGGAKRGVISEKIRQNTERLLQRVDRDRLLPREAAMGLALERLRGSYGRTRGPFSLRRSKGFISPARRAGTKLGLKGR